MKILLVSSFLPFPLHSGGHVRLYNILKELSKNHSITLVCEIRKNQTQNDIKEVGKFCEEVFTVPRKKQWSFLNIVRTGFSSDSFLITGHRSPEMAAIISNLLSNKNFDLIHVETFYVMQNLPETSLPVVLVEHNIEYLVYKRYLSHSNIMAKPFIMVDVLKLKKAEEEFWRKASKVITVSEKEASIVGKKTEVVPNGVDLSKYKFRETKNEEGFNVLFIGDFKWLQNRNSLEWILREIWPLFEFKMKEKGIKRKYQLRVVGRKIPDELKRLKRGENVVFEEGAGKDAYEVFFSSSVLISPTRVGGGTSFKILEAMATGVPVITTKLGNEGIEARENKEVLIAKTSEEFVEQLLRLINDKDYYGLIAGNARELIEDKYNWKKIIKRLEEVYEQVRN